MNNESIIDLRSDTVTRPTPAMLEAMFSAEVGDDVFEEDPTIKKLEARSAALFGKEAGLFVPSGTMANQISIKLLSQPGQEIICDKQSHIYYHEGGGIAFNSGLSMRLLDGDRGRITASQVVENINAPEHIYLPLTALVSLENTSNKGGGSFYKLEQIRDIADVCKTHNLKMHLDGARIFNALAETGDEPEAIGQFPDTISFCFSKGLGAPVGSIIVSTKENILRARRIRKVFGGGMRQAGYLAAACIYALDHHIDRLRDDHRRAKEIGSILQEYLWVEDILPVDTNIVIFRITEKIKSENFLQTLNQHNIKAVAFGKQTIRMVTHLDITDEMIGRLKDVLNKSSRSF